MNNHQFYRRVTQDLWKWWFYAQDPLTTGRLPSQHLDPALLKLFWFTPAFPTCLAEQFFDIKRTSREGNFNVTDFPYFAISFASYWCCWEICTDRITYLVTRCYRGVHSSICFDSCNYYGNSWRFHDSKVLPFILIPTYGFDCYYFYWSCDVNDFFSNYEKSQNVFLAIFKK